MKLERLSENQIRCTLNKADLADRHLLLNELAYGTDKAKELFRDMMEQASEELGFEVNDIPLMIEAIPVSPDCLILIITKVEDPEELDTRFSRFSKYTDIETDTDEESESGDEDDLSFFENASSLMHTISDLVENIEQAKKQNEENNDKGPTFVPLSASIRENAAKKKGEKSAKKKEDSLPNYRIFSFQNINDISKAAVMAAPIYHDRNSLYKSPSDHLYYLIVNNDSTEAENYQRVCNLLSEYGTKVKANYAMPYYFEEHFKIIIKNDAIQTLASI